MLTKSDIFLIQHLQKLLALLSPHKVTFIPQSEVFQFSPTRFLMPPPCPLQMLQIPCFLLCHIIKQASLVLHFYTFDNYSSWNNYHLTRIGLSVIVGNHGNMPCPEVFSGNPFYPYSSCLGMFFQLPLELHRHQHKYQKVLRS